MEARLEIRDTGEGLLISVTASHISAAFWRVPVELALGAIFLNWAHQSRLPNVAFLALSGFLAFAIVKDVVSLFRGTEVELMVTRDSWISSGHASGGYTPCSVKSADISNLEFRNAKGGGDEPEKPRGLYVEYQGQGRWSTGTCLLPHIDEAQAKQVIEAILRRFPDLPLAPFEPSGLILLNLNKPKV